MIRELRLLRRIVRRIMLVVKALLKTAILLVLCVGIYAVLMYAVIGYVSSNNCCDDYHIDLTYLSEDYFWCPCDSER